MKIGFFSDPHLGAKRSAHSTVRGQENYRETLYNYAKLAASRDYVVVCGGDLFDKFSNNEETVFEGYQIASMCKKVLAGNHDVSNRTDQWGSLGLLSVLKAGHVCISPDPSKPFVDSWEVPNIQEIFAIPHCLTQEVFEASVRQACVKGGHLLLLHCNVGDGYGPVEGDGSSLWLTSELQKLVVESFGLCLVGHEHVPRELHGGRIVVMGNTFPLTFGEIAPRYTYCYDTKTQELTKELLFNPRDSYMEWEVEDFLRSEGKLEVDQLLVEITGDLDRARYAEFSRYLYMFWKTNPHLLAVKNGTVMARTSIEDVEEGPVKLTLPEIVGRAIEAAGYSAEAKELEQELGL